MNQEPRMHVNEDGTKYWMLNGKYHRVDGPAIECIDGSKAWLQNNKYHREDGAAMEHPNGDKAWWMNGKRCDDVVAWAKALLHHQGIKPTQDDVDAKIAEVMQMDLFN